MPINKAPNLAVVCLIVSYDKNEHIRSFHDAVGTNFYYSSN